jgi:enterochelin esterase-like enzyme
MKTICAVLLAAATMAGCAGDEGQLFRKNIPAPSLRGNIINEPVEQPIAVYLPPGYASGADKYPAVYFLPGYDTAIDAFLDGTFQGFSLLEAMDRLIAEGRVREMIVVVVNGRNVLGGSFFANSPVTGKWENFLIRDVVRYVDKNYKTLPFRETRGIAGHSTGGTAAFHIALRHPNVFAAAYSMSPGLFDGDGKGLRALFGDAPVMASLVEKQGEWASMAREAAQLAFLSYVDMLFQSGGPADLGQAFVCAYGAAFSPDPQANAPYTVFPVDPASPTRSSVTSAWEWGFGRIDDRIRLYEEKQTKIGNLVLEVGTEEADDWIIAGCEYVSQRLHEAGIDHRLIKFNGGHEDRLRQRIEEHVLPFFSGALVLE